MRRQALLNLFMLVLVVALTLLVLLDPGPDPAPERVTVGTQAADEIHRIELHRAGAPPLVLERNGDGWRLAGQPRWPLNAALIEQVTALPQSVSHVRYPIAEMEPGEVGLAPPRWRLRLDDTEYRFGAQEPLNHRRYLQRGGMVHLVTDTLIHQLSDAPLDWVSRRLLPAGTAPDRLRLPRAALQRDRQGQWRLDPPDPSLTPDALNAFVEGWRLARALAVEPYGAETGAEQIEVTLRDRDRPVRFEVIRRDDTWLFQRADLGLRYRLAAATGQHLLRLPTTSQDRRIPE